MTEKWYLFSRYCGCNPNNEELGHEWHGITPSSTLVWMFMARSFNGKWMGEGYGPGMAGLATCGWS